MKLRIGLLGALKRFIWQRRCFTSIHDLPVLIWFKIHETQDLGLLYKGLKFGANVNEIWTNIYNEFIKEIGLSDDYLAYLEKLKHIATLQYESILNPSPIVFFELASEKLELEEKKSQKGVNYNEIIEQVSKSQGYSVRKVSVVEFYSCLKINGK